MSINDEKYWIKNFAKASGAATVTSKKTKVLTTDACGPAGYDTAFNMQMSKKKQISENNAIKEAQQVLIMKKAWELATSPLKQVPMNAIMAYMSGNSLQIFSITMTVMLVWNPLKAITRTRKSFQPFINATYQKLMQPMVAYVLCQCVLMLIAFFKLNWMGLLPTTTSDWIAWEKPREFTEHVVHSIH
ncbi:ER membrane protein complex subunit 4 [Schizosaccharomyces japonicus yFS275]|uniref:ER membrane protein complex subunit 4 n=1 Tax=Schizosaccharomyces japonicus (strain yFS275 / FY16936) TaxID=402676 RepID=B6K1I4_SCHJY|nr:ER membrane protein complex subunit 4 [Schizosaccharomyces japonicus yFS275]EEB07805.1 ER membrane protein complex subunit 4 [Schizosaccharomyces japonicus yFS275]